MKNSIILIMFFSAYSIMGQQVEGLKIEKKNTVSSIERKIDNKSNDSLAKDNLKNIKLNNNFDSTFGTANKYNSEIQNNVNALQNNVNSFNNNTFNRMGPQGQGIQLKKRK